MHTSRFPGRCHSCHSLLDPLSHLLQYLESRLHGRVRSAVNPRPLGDHALTGRCPLEHVDEHVLCLRQLSDRAHTRAKRNRCGSTICTRPFTSSVVCASGNMAHSSFHIADSISPHSIHSVTSPYNNTATTGRRSVLTPLLRPTGRSGQMLRERSERRKF